MIYPMSPDPNITKNNKFELRMENGQPVRVYRYTPTPSSCRRILNLVTRCLKALEGLLDHLLKGVKRREVELLAHGQRRCRVQKPPRVLTKLIQGRL